MNMMLAIFAGGGLGAVLRHVVVAAETRMFGAGFAYATFAVNVLGCLVIGGLIEYAALREQVSPEARAFLTTGVLGGFTTFSAFSVEVFKLAENGQMVAAVLYALASVVFCVAGVFGGVYLIRGVMG